jgi:hypothetical protein
VTWTPANDLQRPGVDRHLESWRVPAKRAPNAAQSAGWPCLPHLNHRPRTLGRVTSPSHRLSSGYSRCPLYLYGIFSICAIVAGVLGLRKPLRGPSTTVLAGTGIALGALTFLMSLVSLGVQARRRVSSCSSSSAFTLSSSSRAFSRGTVNRWEPPPAAVARSMTSFVFAACYGRRAVCAPLAVAMAVEPASVADQSSTAASAPSPSTRTRPPSPPCPPRGRSAARQNRC